MFLRLRRRLILRLRLGCVSAFKRALPVHKLDVFRSLDPDSQANAGFFFPPQGHVIMRAQLATRTSLPADKQDDPRETPQLRRLVN